MPNLPTCMPDALEASKAEANRWDFGSFSWLMYILPYSRIASTLVGRGRGPDARPVRGDEHD